MGKAPTNIEIDDEKVRAIMDRYGVHTKTAAVDLALRHLAGRQPMSRDEALATRGAGAIGELPEDARSAPSPSWSTSSAQVPKMARAYLDGTLPEADRQRFDAHLAECPYCTEYLDQMRTTIAGLGRIEEGSLSPERRAQLLDAFRRLGDH